MPVVSFANRKGGSGKTTSALHLACQIARTADVTIIDADPNHPITKWAAKPGKPGSLTVITNDSENAIVDEIEEAAGKDPFVIVDLEGIASQRVSYAIQMSDLVIIPMQKDQQDADCGIDIIRNLRSVEKASRRRIPFRILFTRVPSAAEGRTAMHIQRQIIDNLGELVFQTQIIQREVLRTVYSTGGALYDLSTATVYALPNAVGNIEAFKQEVIDLLRILQDQEQREVA